MSTKNQQSFPNVCPGCDLLLTTVSLQENHSLVCPRCFQVLLKDKHNSLIKTFAVSLAGLLLFIPAVSMPLLTMGILGTKSQTSIISSTLNLFLEHQYIIGGLVFLTAILLPLYILSSLFIVSSGILAGKKNKWFTRLFRQYNHLTDWAMTDIYLVAIFITMIKMSHSGEIELNIGFFCFIGLVLSTISSQTVVQKPLFWKLLDSNGHTPPPMQPYSPIQKEENQQDRQHIVCHSCHKTVRLDFPDPPPEKCSCCGATLHRRKRNSLQRTWALLACGVIFSFPANLLPIMEVEYFGATEQSTIMDGIIYFIQEGSYGIGIIILTASILVPLFKIIGMVIILLTIHFRVTNMLRHKMAMFRFIEFIGRWSMLDIFVIALLSSLVQFGFLSTIKTAPAAVYFSFVVLSTMFAAITFDSRLLWDHNDDGFVKSPSHTKDG